MIKKTIISREGAKVEKFSVKHNKNEYNYLIQEPTFEQLSVALSESVGLSGKLNMSGGGKVIFELCCSEHDKEITDNPRLLMAVCINLFETYVIPVDAEIKKN